MDVLTILNEKRKSLEQLANPLAVRFTAEEINVLGDETNLQCFKLQNTCPYDFKKSDNIFTCFSEIIDGAGVYKVLEFCMLYNQVLVKPVSSVIPQLARVK